MRMPVGMIHVPFKLIVVASTLCWLNCKDNKKDHQAAPATRAIATRLVSEPSAEVSALLLHVDRVKVAVQSDPKAVVPERDWVLLGRCNRRLRLDPGSAEGAHDLNSPEPKPQRAFNRIALVLGPGPHAVLLANGREEPLRIPEQLAKGIPLELPAPLTADKTTELQLVLDTARSIQRSTDAAGAAIYTFRPCLRVVETANAGAVTGKLLDLEGRALAGHLVTAQQGPGAEGATLVRSVRTAPDGAYRLDLLPLHQTYHLLNLAHPASPGQPGLEVRASAALRLDRREDLACTLNTRAQTAPVGHLGGTIRTRVDASMHDEVELLQELPGGRFAVQAVLAVPAADGATSSYRLADLPPGQYLVRHSRITLDASGHPFRAVSPLKPATVVSGVEGVVDF